MAFTLAAGCAEDTQQPAAVPGPLPPARTATPPAGVLAIAAGEAGRVHLGLIDGRIATLQVSDGALTVSGAGQAPVIAVSEVGGEVLSLAANGDVVRTPASGAGARVSHVDLAPMPRAALFSSDGSQLIVGSELGEIQVFDARSGALRFRLVGHRGEPYSLALHPSSPLLVSTSADADVRAWDLTTGAPVQVFDNDVSTLAAAFSKVDGTLATGGADRRITLRETATWRANVLRTFEPPRIVASLAWSPDGRRLAVGTADDRSLADGDVHVLDRATGTSMASLDVRRGIPLRLSFIDDRTIVGVNGLVGSELLVWELPAVR
jgi:WD40 repeat protein